MADFARVYQIFDPGKPLPEGDPAYVDWQADVGLGDVKRQLANSVRLTRQAPVQRLFTGMGGGGKTTELLRLAAQLRDLPAGERHFVSVLDAGVRDDAAFDVDQPEPIDLLLDMLSQLVTDLRAAGIGVKAGKRLSNFLQAVQEGLRGALDSGITLDVTDPSGIVGLSTTFRRHPSQRSQLRRLLEGQLPTLLDAVNDELLPAVRTALADAGFADLLILVDQLDRLPEDVAKLHQLFWTGRGTLKALDCHVVYTTPVDYAYSRAGVRLDAEYGEILGLPLLPVTAADEQLRRRAEATMREIVRRRLAVAGTAAEAVFAPADEVLTLLVALSGGHLRSLFLLIRTAIESSDLSAPLTLDHVQWTADRLAAKYLDPLDGTERDVLVTVHETKDKPDGDTDLELFYSLLRSQYVLAYAAGGDRWYDWNPLFTRSRLASR